MSVAGSVRISEDEGRLVHLGFFATHREVVFHNEIYMQEIQLTT